MTLAKNLIKSIEEKLCVVKRKDKNPAGNIKNIGKGASSYIKPLIN